MTRRRTKTARIYFDGDRALIPLANARGVAQVDTEDAPLVLAHKWRLHSQGYASAGAGCLMHRFLCEGRYVDHVNGDKLDNRRANLRPVTKGQNAMNAKKPRDGVTSRFKGVSRFRSGKWIASIMFNGERRHLGYFFDEEAAAKAYDAAARELCGEFARLNFPESRNG